MHDLIKHCVEFLNIRGRYTIELDSRYSQGNFRAFWEVRVRNYNFNRHLIRVYLDRLHEDARTLETLIAHEFIHAWQYENGHKDIHGESFQFAAAGLEDYLKSVGFSQVNNIYIFESDGHE